MPLPFASTVRRCAVLRLALCVLVLSAFGFGGMKAGVASRKITPSKLPFWLSGYAARTTPAKTVAQDIFAKALAIEDDSGHRAVVVTLDLIGIPRSLRDEVTREVEAAQGLDPTALLLNCSHTHSGPAVHDNLEIMFDFDDADRAKVLEYREFLRSTISAVVGEALKKLEPAAIGYGTGSADFAADRRALRVKQADPSANPATYIDHTVPVLKVTSADGRVLAILFGYACHNTTLTGEFLEISGDYAGHAQADLEKAYPGTTAMFLMLCGADQNPNPRSRKELAADHGQSLAYSVKSALAQSLSPVEGQIQTSLVFRALPVQVRSRQEIDAERENPDIFRRRRASWVLGRIERGEDVGVVDYPVQALRIGDDFVIVGLGGEVVVEYGLRIKELLPGKRVIVAGYSNDVMCYIPTQRILREGGYEADDSMIYYGQSAPFLEDVEERVMAGVTDALAAVGIRR